MYGLDLNAKMQTQNLYHLTYLNHNEFKSPVDCMPKGKVFMLDSWQEEDCVLFVEEMTVVS
jgi:hypothetical protein